MRRLFTVLLLLSAAHPAHAANERAMRSLNHFRALAYRQYAIRQSGQPYHGTQPLARDPNDHSGISLRQYGTLVRQDRSAARRRYANQLSGFLGQSQ